jgi:hypothetical protein
MTTIITRLFKDTGAAQAAVDDLLERGHDAGYIQLISGSDAGLAERIRAARVSPQATTVYAPMVARGHALLVVRAPFNPMGTARNAIQALARHPSIPVAGVDANEYIREQPSMEARQNLLPGTVFFMSNPHRALGHGHVFGQNPILPSRERRSAIAGGGYMSTKFWPMKLISADRPRHSVTDRPFTLSGMFGIPTLLSDTPSRELIKTTL